MRAKDKTRGNWVQVAANMAQPRARPVLTAGVGRKYRLKIVTLGYRNTSQVAWSKHFPPSLKKWLAREGQRLRGNELSEESVNELMAILHEYGQLPVGVWLQGPEI